MITSLAHINLLAPPQASTFYSQTLGLTPRPVPEPQRGSLAWFDIGSSTQQLHIALGLNENPPSSRHPCFRVESPEALGELRQRIWEHCQNGDAAAPLEAAEPGAQSSGAQGKEYPSRFFVRDFAGNRLEFSL